MADAVAVLYEATQRWERAKRAVDIAETHLSALVPGAPLRLKAEATKQLRAADAEAAAARRAYEEAQDQPCPEQC